MQPPPEVVEILSEILSMGLLRIRAMSDQSRRVFVESDHLHNLPSLIADYAPERLEYYLQAERPCFIEQSSHEQVQGFAPLWHRLAAFLDAAKAEALSGQ